MKRRDFIIGSSGISSYFNVWAGNNWGASEGYPVGLVAGLRRDPSYRVGNYSGGFESSLPHHVLAGSLQPSALEIAPLVDFKYRFGFSFKSPSDYMEQRPTTGLLICRGSQIFVEKYGFSRSQTMRLTSWSMAKSVTSLLLGICIDRKLIDSYDDVAEKYVPELRGTLHGMTTIRNLSNMSSGAEILHERDNSVIYPSAFLSKSSSIKRTVAGWNQRREEQGKTFNYNELCALTVGMVVRGAAGSSLSSFAEKNLWRPLGAEEKATWTTDSEGNEFNCIGFAARLRDWARLGNLIANNGRVGSTQIVSESWIRECTSWGERDGQVRMNVARKDRGYKAHLWHMRSDGSRPYFNGADGQYVLIDMLTKTVLVHTAVDEGGNFRDELFAMFEAATKI